MTTPLRFATFLAPNMAPVYRFLADRSAGASAAGSSWSWAAPSTSSKPARSTWG
jgi:hypothetical protein